MSDHDHSGKPTTNEPRSLRKVDVVAELGLPDPADLPFSDLILSVVYSNFCASLRYCDETRTSIATDKGVFEFPCDLGPYYFPHARVLAGLLRPTATDLDEIRGKANLDEPFEDDPSTEQLASLAFYRVFESFPGTPNYALLADGKPSPDVLVRIDAGAASSPGNSWVTTHVARRFNRDWAILLKYNDVWDTRGAEYPRVVGFARIDNLRRTAGTVFITAEIASGCMPDSFGEFPSCAAPDEEPLLSPQDREVLSLCFSDPPRHRRPVWGEMLLTLPDNLLDWVSSTYGLPSMERVILRDRKSRLREFCERLYERSTTLRMTPSDVIAEWDPSWPLNDPITPRGITLKSLMEFPGSIPWAPPNHRIYRTGLVVAGRKVGKPTTPPVPDDGGKDGGE